MNKLPENFECTKYGVHFRLANEEDSKFIIELRTDPVLTRFIHDTDSDIEKQKEWMRYYKEREKEGTEYYFIVSCDEQPCGVIRIYKIHDGIFTIGSILMKKGAPIHCAFATTILTKEIAFEILDLQLEDTFDGVHVDNKKVIKLSYSWGKKVYKHFMDVKGEYLAFSLTKEDYLVVKPKKVRQLELLLS